MENAKIEKLEAAHRAAVQRLGGLVAAGAADEKINRQKQIVARRKSIFDATVAASKSTNRKAETRKLILVGRIFERLADANQVLRVKLQLEADSYLKRADDRELFGLPPVSIAPQFQNPSAPIIGESGEQKSL